MAHKFIPSHSNCDACARCRLSEIHSVHHGEEWEVKLLPWGGKKPWFSYHPNKKLIHHATWSEAMARVCEDLREKQNG